MTDAVEEDSTAESGLSSEINKVPFDSQTFTDSLEPGVLQDPSAESIAGGQGEPTPPLSKNQQKKLKRKQRWEDGREQRKTRRKEKLKARKERHRAIRNEEGAAGNSNPDPEEATADHRSKTLLPRSVQVPVTLILDCQFDDLMTDPERTSLASQITRSYSDNRKAPFQTHLAISSFGGKLKERFDGVLAKAHESWHGVRFFDQDFAEVGELARSWMTAPKGGIVSGALVTAEQEKNGGSADASEADSAGEVVYLTSESPQILSKLKPYSTYVIGGLVDKNRHKGICYKRAMDRGINTARLPIGEYMHMQSRTVLTTNQVIEIMLKWLEVGDWGEAFTQVIPTRKGAKLKEVAAGEDVAIAEDGNSAPSSGLAIDGEI